MNLNLRTVGLAALMLVLAGCGGVSPQPPATQTPGPNPTPQGGPPPGLYSCYTEELALNYYTGDLYITIVPYDNLTITEGGRYSSEVSSNQEGTYSFDPATDKLAYTSGPYTELNFDATYQSARDNNDGVDRIINSFETDSGTVDIYCVRNEEQS